MLWLVAMVCRLLRSASYWWSVRRRWQLVMSAVCWTGPTTCQQLPKHLDSPSASIFSHCFLLYVNALWPHQTTEQQTIIQQYHQTIWYTGRWWVGCYFWYSKEWTGLAPPLYQMYQSSEPTHHRPVYQLHIIWCGAIIASGHYRVKYMITMYCNLLSRVYFSLEWKCALSTMPQLLSIIKVNCDKQLNVLHIYCFAVHDDFDVLCCTFIYFENM